jgi:hypothetical protein
MIAKYRVFLTKRLRNSIIPERGEGRTFFTRSDKGHIDLPCAREGGMGGGSLQSSFRPIH